MNGKNKSQLHMAVKRRDSKAISTLISQGAVIDALTKDEKTPLHLAINAKSIDIINILIDAGADITRNTKHGRPLHIAACTLSVPIIKLFLNKGVDVNVRDKNGDTALHRVCQMRYTYVQHKETCNYLLRCGANVNAENKYKKTPLLCAVEMKDHLIVNILVQYEHDVKLKGNKLALIESLKKLHFQKCPPTSEVLLDCGFSFIKKDADNPEVLANAIRNRHVKALEELLKLGADTETIVLNTDDDYEGHVTLLQLAALQSDANLTPHVYLARAAVAKRDILCTLIDYGANIHAKTKEGWTALLFAMRNRNYKIVEELITRGADISAELKDGTTALHLAVTREGRVVQLVLKNKANVNRKTKAKLTPLHYAAWKGRRENISHLVKYGADVDATTYKNVTPIHFALLNRQYGTVLSLLHHDADIDAQDDFGRTPLHIAVSQGLLMCVRSLLEREANIDIRDKKGRTPFDTALEYASIEHDKTNVYLIENKELEKYMKPFDHLPKNVNSDFGLSSDESSEEDHVLYHNLGICDRFCMYEDESESKVPMVSIFQRYQKFVKNRLRILNMSNEEMTKLKVSRDLILAREVKVMQVKEIDRDITLYDVLTMNYKKLASNVPDENIARWTKVLASQKGKLNYFYWMVKKQINAIERYKMSKMAAKQFNTLFDIRLPDVVIQEIVEYLRKSDLRKILSETLSQKGLRRIPKRRCNLQK